MEQGLSCCTLIDNGDTVIKRLTDATKAKPYQALDSFNQELLILSLNMPHVVNLLDHNEGEGEKYEPTLVLEKLYPIKEVTEELAYKIAFAIIFTVRQLWLRGYVWCCAPKHVMLDKDGEVKLIDFGDDQDPRDTFFSDNIHFDFMRTIIYFCEMGKLDPTPVIDKAFDELVELEYQSLKDVHQPVIFERYKHFLRTESDPNDPEYQKLVPPNRMCYDRAEIISHCVQGSVLDIGCNIGFFTFLYDRVGCNVTGIDHDKGKIEFAKMLSERFDTGAKFEVADIETYDYKEYDTILVLSLFHLLFTSQGYTKDRWINLFKHISSKCEVLIFECHHSILGDLGFTAWGELVHAVKEWGGFERIGMSSKKSDANRYMITCKK